MGWGGGFREGLDFNFFPLRIQIESKKKCCCFLGLGGRGGGGGGPGVSEFLLL